MSSNDTMTFMPKGNVAAINDAETVLDVALSNNIDLDHSCGGMGSCTTCRVIIESDLNVLPARNMVEQDRADERDFAQNERLACQLPPHPGLVVRIPG